MYIRKQIFEGLGNESAFLWGARQTGKSTLLKCLYPDVPYFDLLLNSEFGRFQRNPSLLREILKDGPVKLPVIIDEIQRIPVLLNEIHWLIVNKNIRFILSGSSPRKILQTGGNLLGGRALRYELYPLIFPEITDFDLLRALNHGLLPRHYLGQNAKKLHAAYIGSYLKDEILSEARVRDVESFSRFLDVAAFSNSEIVNYTNIASDCRISAPTVKSYFEILEDTLTGRFLNAFQKKPKRRIILAPKFYFFDVGIANYLLKRGVIDYGGEAFGKAFEHFIYQEIFAHSSYSDLNYPMAYWRTSSGREVDFILGDHEVAIEVKATREASPRHLSGLRSFGEEYSVREKILVSDDADPRQIEDIKIFPWRIFLEKLWSGEIIS
jgi:predicted AAA+ superfamily ATPase